MENTLTYKGYTARVEYSAEDDALVGHLIGISDIVGFHADDVAGIKQAFQATVDDYVALNAETAQKPYSGNLMFRVDPELHAAAVRAAKANNMSLKQWGARLIAAAAADASSDAPITGVKLQDAPEDDGSIKERTHWDDREIVRLASGTIQIRRDGAVQPVVVKDVLRSIAEAIGVDENGKNTRTFGRDVIDTLVKQRTFIAGSWPSTD